ncbi:1-acyl-sn-glycerol-3-phosphate acyltransferase [Chryseolinea serpens]|uniref:1-acyl-sn-glycerol-3-phosphate acyltransferase n=1 Tax=Chryseolinea serpens TaxID=947013 RepID=A0A1M5WW71_9BACT|nr:lysophospholipid acyltransferase family protein [Chryseolinea serpens]SHH91837.1 1-acyl-sn-glycerol-3-phosphate acyltransferase [Chryseolinea serpens]
MKILRGIHTAWGSLVFGILFLVLLPLFLIPIVFPSQYKLVGILNRWWARLLFTFIGVPFRTEYRAKLDPKRQYIYCSNHFSYLDIPAMGLAPHNAIFVGKSGIETVPLFGWMYGKLHITVDRKKLKSRYTSVKRSMEAIDEGKNLIIFPEGGIVTKKDPVMGPFKDGAFRVAVEKQIPIVPVTIPYNWIILPPDEFLLRWHPLRVIFHTPVETAGLTAKDIDTLKQRVFTIIDQELKQHLKNEN